MKRSALTLALTTVLVGSMTASAGAVPPTMRHTDPGGSVDTAHARVTASTETVSATSSTVRPTTDETRERMPAKGTDRRQAGNGGKADFVPAVAVPPRLGRYFVVLKAPSVAERIGVKGRLGATAQRQVKREALAAQAGAIAEATSLGGRIVFRYGTLINAFSTVLSSDAAAKLVGRKDVASVQPVSIVLLDNASSVPFIGATKVWQKYGAKGQGLTLALVDTGIDYTHKDFGGPGTVAAYERNDPNVVEPGTFPTSKVIGGYDFVGGTYDVLDGDPSNDIPRPDFDPLDRDGHGSHTGGTCCGIGVPGIIGPGVAPRVKILAYKVWNVGNSTDDVLVAAYERAVDPNQDGDTSDHADVLSFSGGVDYGTLNSVEAVAAQRVVDIGTIFVAAAGNAGNQPSGGAAYITGTPANARGVISVAASLDEFLAHHVTVDSPSGVTFPDDGVAIHQSWTVELTGDISKQVIDAREFDPPADPGTPTAGDRLLCDTTPGSFGGNIALIYKASAGAGDCTADEKVFRAQEMGASAVILWNGFGGFPFDLAPGDFVDQLTIPALMLSEADSIALADATSPAPPAWNTVTVNATITALEAPVPVFADSMADFSSEGPARLTGDLKPDITAPGVNITSASVGTGDGSLTISGTSMATPHVAGVAVLLRQLHPSWSPAKIKALMMNTAVSAMKNSDLSHPVPATVKGAGRVDVFHAANARSLAWPGSLSFGLRPAAGDASAVRSFQVRNFDSVAHDYRAVGSVRFSDHDKSIASITVSTNGASFGDLREFSLAPGATRQVWARLTLHPDVVPEAEQLYRWYGYNANVDGWVSIFQDGPHSDFLRVPWHVTPLAVARNGVSASSLDLTGGPATFAVTEPASAGTSYADLYLLGTTDPVESNGEEDIVAVGARSFTGPTIDGVGEGLPAGTDALAGETWLQFLTLQDEPTEPVEFVVQGAGNRNTTDTLEIDIKVDTKADGVFADDDLQADYLVVKPPGSGTVCVYDLSRAHPFNDCAATYFADYSVYNTNLTGLAVDASAIGLSGTARRFSYQVTSCTGRLSGDVPGEFCDTAGSFDDSTGTWDLVVRATNPPLVIDKLVCTGFWHGPDCDVADPIHVSTGSADPDEDPSILLVFPNDKPERLPTIVTTHT